MDRLSVSFYIRLWLVKTFGAFGYCINSTKCSKEGGTRPDDPTFGDMLKYFGMLSNAFTWHMSIRRECVEDLR